MQSLRWTKTGKIHPHKTLAKPAIRRHVPDKRFQIERAFVIEALTDTLKRLLPGGGKGSPLVPVVRLSGVIGKAGRLQTGMTMQSAAGPLAKAFGIKKAPAVAVVVDSPGGSPVQSHLIFKRIRALAEEKEKPVYVFVEDVAASGGYMVACAGDEIIVDPASIVGSIGVVSAGFGFVEAINKLGVERRVYTAGENKAILDPFKPEKKEDIERLKTLQEEVHDMFIDLVKSRRGDVLANDPDLFTGLFWSGERSVSLGLADRTGDLRGVLQEKFGEKVRMKVISVERTFFGRRLGFGSGIAAGLAELIFGELDDRSMRARYGR
jgi:signal peptide peptidase SppA